MTVTEDNAGKMKGINIQDALNILNSRSIEGRERLEAPTPELRKLGQTLDLMNTQTWTRSEMTNGTKCGCVNDNYVDENEGLTKDLLYSENHNKNGESRVLRELQNQSTSHIFTVLFSLQNERVVTYQKFNEGLNQVILSGNLSLYPNLCMSTTASFALISNSIRDIQSILKERSNSLDMCSAASNIDQLQKYEKEKLNLTAALHLEKIREKNETLKGGDDKVRRLLKKEVHALQKKIGICMELINNVIDDLRCVAIEIEE